MNTCSISKTCVTPFGGAIARQIERTASDRVAYITGNSALKGQQRRAVHDRAPDVIVVACGLQRHPEE